MTTLQDQYLLHTDDGSLILYSPEYGEGYRSIEGAFTESKLLFLDASGFSDRLKTPPIKNEDDTLLLLDIGLGLGYNALSAITEWQKPESNYSLTLVSIEKNPDLVKNLCSGDAIWQKSWPSNWLDMVSRLNPHHQNGIDFFQTKIFHPNKTKDLHLKWIILICDALDTGTMLQKFFDEPNMEFDFIFQDPFSPKKNPELWSIDFFNQLYSLCKPNGRLTTYSVARIVRENFMAANWFIEKIPGTIGKKNWLRCYKTKPTTSSYKIQP